MAGKDRGGFACADQYPGGSFSCVYAGGGAALSWDRKGWEPFVYADPPRQYGGGHHRWHRCPGAGRHRPGGFDAGYGGEMRALQGVCGCGCVSSLHRQQGCRYDCKHSQTHFQKLRRDQPRRYLGAALLWDRAAAQGRMWNPGIPWWPAWHRDHRERSAAQCDQGHRPGDGQAQNRD